ncbi:hypothetical protein MPSEU_000668000 [Mayamaea pseudoterrestris]|nr:hypothetical protein MPSEU_000668000 [Mayamaea pseudoterrestris]
MSLSNLQSQLTALNNPKNAGLSFASSKRHEDAVGRGLHYSVKHGQTMADKSVRFKPTLLHAKARDAADVPLKVLEENCREALVELGLDDLVSVLCNSAEAADASQIRSILLQLTVLLDESLDECLQVLEYMLRRYNLHVQYGSELLWTLLPYAGKNEMWVYFHRCLLLVDLASDQTYLWLRPYVSVENNKKIPSALVAQHVLKNTSWLTKLVQVVQAVKTDDHFLLSWSMKLLLQGFAWLARDTKADKEAVIRTIFSCLLGSFSHPVRRYWSYVVVSSMVEHMELAPETIDLLVTKIVRGAAPGLETEADALTTILSILLPPKRQLLVDDACFLSLVGLDKWLGCSLTRTTFDRLVGLEFLPSLLGYLHRDRRVIVAPLLAAVVVMSMNQGRLSLIVELAEESALRSIWMDRQLHLVASVTANVVGKYFQNDELALEPVRLVLKTLHEIDAVSCELGVAHAIDSMSDKMLDCKQKLIDLLNGIVAFDESAMVDSNDLVGMLPPVGASDEMNIDEVQDFEHEIELPSEQALAIVHSWSTNCDKEHAVAAAHLLSDKDLLEHLRLAIYLEAAVRSETSNKEVLKLLELAISILGEAKDVSIAVIPGLVLLERGDVQVRVAAMALLAATFRRLESEEKWSNLVEIGDQLEISNVSVKMGGQVLSSILASCLKRSREPQKLRNALMRLCVSSAVYRRMGHDDNEGSGAWLFLPLASGMSTAAAVLLDSLEETGEELAPLLTRWNDAGRPILERIVTHGEVESIPSALVRTLLKMLKGVKVVDPQIIISSGPSQEGTGRRTRSYSVGKMDGLSVLDPYPADMKQLIEIILKEGNGSSCGDMVASILVTDVVGSASWREQIFAKFAASERVAMAISLIHYGSESLLDDASQAFNSLPLDSSDLCSMVEDLASVKGSIVLTYISDFVRSNSSRLLASRRGDELAGMLFNALKESSLTASTHDDETTPFLQQSVLLALQQILVTSPAKQKVDARRTKSWITILLSLLGASTTTDLRLVLLTKTRTRSAALSILSNFALERPGDVMPSLGQVVAATVSLACGKDGSYTQFVRQTLTYFIPLFKKIAPLEGATIERIFTAFVSASQEQSEAQHLLLYSDFVHVLVQSNLVDEVAGLICLYLAERSHSLGNQGRPSHASSIVVQVLESGPSAMQVATLLTLLEYCNEIISSLTRADSSIDDKSSKLGASVSSMVLIETATSGITRKSAISVDKEAGLQRVVNLAKFIIDTFADCLLLGGVQHYFKKTGNAAELCLKIWQQLLEVHTACRNRSDCNLDVSVQHFLDYAVESLDQSRGIIQNLLPVPIFLASVSSIIAEGRTADVRSNALHLLADRAAGFTSASPEAILFVDLVPEITGLLTSTEDHLMSPRLRESALLALDQISGMLRKASAFPEGAVQNFLNALSEVTRLLATFEDVASLDAIQVGERQLICSLALCAGSLVRSVGTASVAVLPTLVRSLVMILNCTSSYGGPSEDEVQVLRLGLIKGLVAVIESVPHFMTPHLPLILTEQAVLSKSLRTDVIEKLDPIKVTMERLDAGLAASVPCRILVPALCKAISLCSTLDGVKSVMLILEQALGEASSAEIIVQRSAVLKALTTACDVDGVFADKVLVVKVCEKVLVALVMKLSELQLRRVLVFLREWRGASETRKFAFWSFTQVLSQKLKAIFLPCLSMVWNDAIAELNNAAQAFASASTKASEAKRRRLNEELNSNYNEGSMSCIEPLLLCLEHSLRTDARGGGAWIRTDEEARYHALLSPLGNLLEARLPENYPVVPVAQSAYHQLVHGVTESSGCVMGCLTALAAAAGNEQLWKPLNHAVLEACANEHRAEVRRAGLECLLSLMRSLGEEYMVLLPECLPVLSEAMEDSTEDNAALARDIVTLAEELIGESLQESLR